MIDVRKLAAIDVALLGPVVIIAEFVIGVIGPIGLGAFVASRSHSNRGLLLAAYFMTLGANYIPMLAYAVGFRQRGRARAEIADELMSDRRRAMRKYRRGSLLLLLPLVVPALALLQEQRRRATRI